MVDKVKKNIKCLDISINAAYDSPTSHPSVPFSTLVATTKYATVATAQAHVSQVKAAAQAYASFLANAISWLYQKSDFVIKNKDVCFSADSLISGHSLIISGAISTFSSGPSPNLQVFDLTAQTSPPNQIELGDVGELEKCKRR